MGSKRPASGRTRKARPRHVVSIPAPIHDRLRALADTEGRKIQWLAQQALLAYLERVEKGDFE